MEDKIKIEEELEFLKESFEAEVITPEEYEKAKSRMESQLRKLESGENKVNEEKSSENKKAEKQEKPSEEMKEELNSEVKEDTQKDIKPEKKAEEKKTGFKAKVEEKPAEKEEPDIEIKELKDPSKFKEQKKVKEEPEEEKIQEPDEKEEDTNDIINNGYSDIENTKENKTSIWMPIAAVAVFLIVFGYFAFVIFTGEKLVEEEKSLEKVLPSCFSDADCLKEGMIGFCSNLGNEDAECEFKEAVKVNFIVLNTQDCFNCDTSRVEKIIKGWFPGVVKSEISYNSEEGKSLVNDLSINLLPAYIFDSSLEETFKYGELKGIFSKVNDKYVLRPGASGSTFYTNKQEVSNKLEVFLMEGDISTEKAEKNIQEFLDLFDSKIEYNKHIVNKESSLVKSLDINTFPSFLVNNKIKFSGVQPAETIKENFCKLNKLDECNNKLTESLV